MLNEQQQAILTFATRNRQSFFLSGIAGSGKTYLLREIIQGLVRRGRRVGITAFTGLAAQHLEGTTISKLLGLGLSKNLGDLGSVRLHRAERNLRGMTDLVIDEVSMVSGDFLELVDQAMRGATGVDEPFGGIRVILGGDFMQLPPIHAQGKPKYPWAFEYPEFARLPAFFLTQSMRHSSLTEIGLLNEFRQGTLSPAGKSFLESRVKTPGPNAVDLYPLRREVEAINQARLSSHQGQLVRYPTHFSNEEWKKGMLQHLPIGEEVQLKVGVPVIILTNDVQGRFVNGSQGIIQRTSDHAVEVERRNGDRVWVQEKTWEIVDPYRGVIGEATGLPITLGWAATIHRAQGMTLDEVVTDISRCWEPGQAYVALSRTRSLENLYLLNPPKEIKVDPVALSYVNALS